jgi:hypothetical protein
VTPYTFAERSPCPEDGSRPRTRLAAPPDRSRRRLPLHAVGGPVRPCTRPPRLISAGITRWAGANPESAPPTVSEPAGGLSATGLHHPLHVRSRDSRRRPTATASPSPFHGHRTGRRDASCDPQHRLRFACIYRRAGSGRPVERCPPRRRPPTFGRRVLRPITRMPTRR